MQERRNERLARKNPDRIQKQIDDLKAIPSKGGTLTRHEEQVLEGLEKELRAVRKAREAVGDKAPSFGRGRDGESRPGALGKRRRGSRDASSSDDDVPDDVRSIPMPRDTPPPISKDVLDQWYARRHARRNPEPAGRQDGRAGDAQGPVPREAPVIEHRTVYEAKPVMRDLQKEAVSAFVPAAVQMKMARGQGHGRLLEPDEAEKLEREGYLPPPASGEREPPRRTATVADAPEDEEEK